jgi:hypothetical protein
MDALDVINTILLLTIAVFVGLPYVRSRPDGADGETGAGSEPAPGTLSGGPTHGVSPWSRLTEEGVLAEPLGELLKPEEFPAVPEDLSSFVYYGYDQACGIRRCLEALSAANLHHLEMLEMLEKQP